jgi:hypothetical protein
MFNTYSLIGGAVALLLVAGTIGYQNHQIHHYHKAFDNEHSLFLQEHQLVVAMTTRQNEQYKTSEQNVIKVVQGPEQVKTIVKEIHDTPLPTGCNTPDFPQDVKDSY